MTEIALATGLTVVLTLALTALVMGARTLLSPAVSATVRVNGEREIAALTGVKLLPTLAGAGIPLPSACAGAGTCGLCRVHVDAGGGDILPNEAARFSRAEIRDGLRLACQVVIRGNMVVRVPEDILGAETFICRVAASTMLAPLVKEIVLDVPQGQDFAFRAGQFVQVTAPSYALTFSDIAVSPEHAAVWDKLGWSQLKTRVDTQTTRAYSIASRPGDKGKIVLDIRLAVPPPGTGDDIPPGKVSSYLFSLEPGDVIEVSGPYGTFCAQDTEREMVLIGGGVGMAPLRAIIHDQLERVGSTRKMSYWYGARSASDVFYADQFDTLAAAHENFSWTVALSEPRPDTGWHGETGFVHDVVWRKYLSTHPAPETCEYYLCGPPLMIDAVLAMLDEAGVEPESIFNDDFGS
ncbi:NADH:ubiquinone reductase (Na(+)-transporting) subunit F [Pelagibacterium xiamenense]|uniref:NADH:ubiquinone reductase (Na(+)-transporting) subunit F n=1 Tax=Pelagibacterium xiamenense TaxID=2901140 RepID=UPI001E4837D7|nr:NADH:ubiquinone reductase (Na(+)-transporting) subunit F [Pelagibacterium xiamenense]MCD7059366.1 NADH:ubiquinone reductase (Na(+)-transporting) subunit F [Pelagibacterium xiamenense]